GGKVGGGPSVRNLLERHRDLSPFLSRLIQIDTTVILVNRRIRKEDLFDRARPHILRFDLHHVVVPAYAAALDSVQGSSTGTALPADLSDAICRGEPHDRRSLAVQRGNDRLAFLSVA